VTKLRRCGALKNAVSRRAPVAPNEVMVPVEHTFASTPQVCELELLYRKHHRRIRWFLRARGIGDQSLDDAVHDVFVVAHRRMPDRDPEVPAALWLGKIARNIAFSHRRGYTRRLRLLEAIPEPNPQPSLDRAVAERDAWNRLEAFLGGLREDQREAFVLIEILGMAPADVATMADVPVNTMYSRLRLARRRFEEHFESVPDQATDFVCTARKGEARTQNRSRTWQLIAASISTPAGHALIGTAVLKPILVVSLTLATVVVASWATGSIGHSNGDRLDAVDASTAAAEPRSASQPSSVQVASTEVMVASSEPIPSLPSVAASTTKSPPADLAIGSRIPPPRRAPGHHSATTLDDAIALLREAEQHLAMGQAHDALAAIDRFRERFANSPLTIERLKLERRAACIAGQSDRATAATRELVALHHASADRSPCP